MVFGWHDPGKGNFWQDVRVEGDRKELFVVRKNKK